MTFRKNIALHFGKSHGGYFYIDITRGDPIIFIGRRDYDDKLWKKIRERPEDVVATAMVHETLHLVFMKRGLNEASGMYDGLYETYVWNIEGAHVLEYLERMSGLPKNLPVFRNMNEGAK
jgi:hypothetical protein